MALVFIDREPDRYDREPRIRVVCQVEAAPGARSHRANHGDRISFVFDLPPYQDIHSCGVSEYDLERIVHETIGNTIHCLEEGWLTVDEWNMLIPVITQRLQRSVWDAISARCYRPPRMGSSTASEMRMREIEGHRRIDRMTAALQSSIMDPGSFGIDPGSGFFGEPTKARKAADAKAKTLLLANLSAEQKAQFEQHKYFDVQVEDRGMFRVHTGSAIMNVEDLANGDRYCAQPGAPMPTFDAALAQKITLETEPKRFFDVANKRPARFSERIGFRDVRQPDGSVLRVQISGEQVLSPYLR